MASNITHIDNLKTNLFDPQRGPLYYIVSGGDGRLNGLRLFKISPHGKIDKVMNIQWTGQSRLK